MQLENKAFENCNFLQMHLLGKKNAFKYDNPQKNESVACSKAFMYCEFENRIQTHCATLKNRLLIRFRSVHLAFSPAEANVYPPVAIDRNHAPPGTQRPWFPQL